MKSYIKYLKRQNKHIQDIHAIFWSSIFTILVIIIVLQYRYNIFYPEYKRVEDPTVVNATQKQKVEKVESVENIYDKYTIVESFNNIISNTKNIIKGANAPVKYNYTSSSTNK